MQGDLPNSLNVPSNSAFCGLADRLYSDTAQILSPTHNFVGLRPTHKVEGCTWDGTDSKRSSFKLVKLWVPSSISLIHLPADIAQDPQFIGFGARFVYLPKKPTRCSRRMCKMTKAAWNKFKKLGKWFEQRTRALISENYGFKANFTQILFCVDMARNP